MRGTGVVVGLGMTVASTATISISVLVALGFDEGDVAIESRRLVLAKSSHCFK